jgi:hypothetical protein
MCLLFVGRGLTLGYIREISSVPEEFRSPGLGYSESDSSRQGEIILAVACELKLGVQKNTRGQPVKILRVI